MTRIKEGLKNRIDAYRNPVYIAYAIAGAAIFVLGGLIASGGAGVIEVAIFRAFNHLGEWLYGPMVAISLFGSFGAIIVTSLIALVRKHYANSLRILLAGSLAYLTALGLKMLELRARPEPLIDGEIVRESSDALLGYPSGHMAVATVLALTAYLYIPKKFHRYITILLVLVGISRMYLGVHFPIDLVGGYGIGLFYAGVMNYVFGSRRYSPVTVETVKSKLVSLGYPVAKVTFASVDARGSVPYFVTFKDKSKYFLKIVGIENNIADWLFKLFRKVAYRRLEDEQPFLSPKRQLEHEAYVALQAKRAGVRTPTILNIFEAQQNRWALTQEMIDGKSLDSIDPKRVTDRTLDKIWEQVNILHGARIVHRDLRSANVFLAKDGEPWLIDFGFSEASVSKDVLYRDVTELIASLSLIVGIERSVKSAVKNVDEKTLKSSLPYLSYTTISGATTAQLKKQKGALKEIRRQLSEKLGVKEVKLVKMKRFSGKTLLIIISIGVLLHVLVPQIDSFSGSLESAESANDAYLLLALGFSVVTYLLSALTYKFLAIYPIQYVRTLIIETASSFASKLGPAGTGSIALNVRYLMKNQHTAIQAGAVSVVNTILGFLGHFFLLVVVLLITRQSLSTIIPDFHLPRFTLLVVILAAVTLLIAYMLYGNFRKFLQGGIKKAISNVAHYKNNSTQLLWAFLTSIGITIANSMVLLICVVAFGLDLTIAQILYVYTVGTIVASVTPTPGGIGGAEAAYVASLTSLGVSTPDAIAIALVFRLLTFWLPIIPGFIAFKYSLKRDYI